MTLPFRIHVGSNWLIVAAIATVVVVLVAVLYRNSISKDIGIPLASYEPWSEEVVEQFDTLVIQDDGRVKPMHTFARFTLMQLADSTKIKFTTEDGEEHKVRYNEWLMDVLFRGKVARELPSFLVEDSDVVIQLGVSPKAKRDRYSYNELLVGRSKLAELTAKYREQRQKFNESGEDPQYELDTIETMILRLGTSVSSYEYMLGQFAYARKDQLSINENILSPELLNFAATLDTVEMLNRMPEITMEQLMGSLRAPASGDSNEEMLNQAMRLFFFHASSGQGLAILPPVDTEDEEWMSVGETLLRGLESKVYRSAATEKLRALEPLARPGVDTSETLLPALKEFSSYQGDKAEARGENTYTALEVKLYEQKPFRNGLVFFIMSFLAIAASWLFSGKAARRLIWICSALALIGGLYVVYGITLRSIIRQRPPIVNLYDTIVFITASAVLLGLLIEWMTRIGIGALIASISGIIGMYLGINYEASEASDTIGQVVAVLNTNFWLATHVTIITMGYAAGLLAMILGMVYVVVRLKAKLTGNADKSFFRTLTKMNYGVICFCLFFSIVGTVLGGIWANYSWGRFWGWDPKENGALLICIWTLVILHAKMGGMIKDMGIQLNAIVLGGIVCFSWWGVNNLGVGLHSYGFTEGVRDALWTAWGVMGLFIIAGMAISFFEKRQKKERRVAAA